MTEHDANAPLTEDDVERIQAALDETERLYPEPYRSDVTGVSRADARRLVAEVRRLRAENAELLDILDRNGVAWPKWASERNERC